jgi:hypothetical protein
LVDQQKLGRSGHRRATVLPEERLLGRFREFRSRGACLRQRESGGQTSAAGDPVIGAKKHRTKQRTRERGVAQTAAMFDRLLQTLPGCVPSGIVTDQPAGTVDVAGRIGCNPVLLAEIAQHLSPSPGPMGGTFPSDRRQSGGNGREQRRGRRARKSVEVNIAERQRGPRVAQ